MSRQEQSAVWTPGLSLMLSGEVQQVEALQSPKASISTVFLSQIPWILFISSVLLNHREIVIKPQPSSAQRPQATPGNTWSIGVGLRVSCLAMVVWYQGHAVVVTEQGLWHMLLLASSNIPHSILRATIRVTSAIKFIISLATTTVADTMRAERAFTN